MGEVYLVKHLRLPRHDALHVLPEAISADEKFRTRFERCIRWVRNSLVA
jgi:serine/threonine-protein kinase